MSNERGKSTYFDWPAECEARLARFERLWQTGVPALDELTRMVADRASDSVVQRQLLAELVKIDLENRWRKAGGKLPQDATIPATVENYLASFAALGGCEDLTRELAVEEYRARHRWGDSPTHESFVTRFPNGSQMLVRELVEIDNELARDLARPGLSEVETRHGATVHPVSGSGSPTARGATRHKHVDFLWQVKPFSELPENVVGVLAGEMAERTYQPKDLLVEQGAAAVSLIVVLDGEIEVTLVDGQGRRRVIDRAGRGTVLGEMALVSNQPHSANVSAVTDVQALVLPVENLHRMARKFPPLGAGFANLAAARLGRREVDVLFDKSVEGYRIKRRLGQGGMAVVYEAEEEASGKRVALKMMRPQLAYDLVAAKRFSNEAATLGGLEHPNIVRVFGSFAAHNTSFMVMELCEGPTLARLIDRCPPLEEDQVWAIIGQLAAALAHAHAAGVLHRDLKPGNILLNWDGVLKLSDFGLARSFLSSGLTMHGEILGTPRYMPPEQLIGTKVDQRADLYALGCIAYELFRGEPLFTEPDVARLLAVQLNWSLETALADAQQRNPETFRPPSDVVLKFLEETLAIDREKRTLDLEKTARLARPIDVDLLWVAGLRR